MAKVKDYLIHFFKGTDKLLLLLCMIASASGVLFVYSATRYSLADGSSGLTSDAKTMIFAIVIGIVIAIVISLIDYDILCKIWYVWAGLGILLMILVMLIGVGPTARADAKTWINLGFFYFQPSELVKVFFITTFAVHLNYVRENINKIKNILLLLLHALVPFFLVAKSGDDGSALVFLFIALVMLFVAGVNWKYILGAVVLGCAAIPIVWAKMSTFQKQRFIVIWNPDKYPNTAYQQKVGLSAMANGGLFGKGLFKGTYTQSGSIPEGYNDMIFTVIGEELGMVGCLCVLLLLFFIILRIIRNGSKAVAGPAQYLCYGIGAMIAVQALINVAMCLKLGPVIGITLPFFSAGGSSTLCLYVAIGVVLSVYRSNYDLREDTNVTLIGVRSPFNEGYRKEVLQENKQTASGTQTSGKTAKKTKTSPGKKIESAANGAVRHVNSASSHLRNKFKKRQNTSKAYNDRYKRK